jgi:hypothetical protein
MNRPHPLPRRNWLGVCLSLLIVLVSGGLALWQVADYVGVLCDRLAQSAAPTPDAAPTDEETARAD